MIEALLVAATAALDPTREAEIQLAALAHVAKPESAEEYVLAPTTRVDTWADMMLNWRQHVEAVRAKCPLDPACDTREVESDRERYQCCIGREIADAQEADPPDQRFDEFVSNVAESLDLPTDDVRAFYNINIPASSVAVCGHSALWRCGPPDEHSRHIGLSRALQIDDSRALVYVETSMEGWFLVFERTDRGWSVAVEQSAWVQ